MHKKIQERKTNILEAVINTTSIIMGYSVE